MKKEITLEDKLKFYEKFNTGRFKKEYQSIPHLPWFIGLSISNIFAIAGILGGLLLHPILFILLSSAVVIPFLSATYTESKRKELIEDISNKKISYADFKELYNSEEWQQLAELYREKVEKELEEKGLKDPNNNNLRSLNAYIISDEKAEEKTEKVPKRIIKRMIRKNINKCEDIEITDEEAKDYMF